MPNITASSVLSFHIDRAAARTRVGFVGREIIQLRDYLRQTDKEKGYEVLFLAPLMFYDWLNNNSTNSLALEAQDEIDEALGLTGKWNKSPDRLDLQEHYEVMDFHGKYAPLMVPFLREGGWEDSVFESDKPSWHFMDFRSIVKNQWMIHFTGKGARRVAREGFRFGVDDVTRLGLTTTIDHSLKAYGGYNFAYHLDDYLRFGRGHRSRGGWKYGKEAVLFRASGAKIYHYGDSEPQVVFTGKTARDIVPIEEGENSERWGVGEDRAGRQLFASDDLSAVVGWVTDNFRQYRKHLLLR